MAGVVKCKHGEVFAGFSGTQRWEVYQALPGGWHSPKAYESDRLVDKVSAGSLTKERFGCANTWKGASEDEVDEIEFFAGRDLPPFYRWFLETMGEDMGSLGHAYLDLRAKTVLAA